MEITFSLPQVFYVGSDRRLNAETLEILLNNLVEINLAWLRAMKRRKITVPRLYSSGVVYARTEWWESTPALYKRGWGDCKSLSCSLVAEMIFLDGIEARPVFRFNPRPGSTDYHILVQTREGYTDPSKKLGMGKDEHAWFRL